MVYCLNWLVTVGISNCTVFGDSIARAMIASQFSVCWSLGTKLAQVTLRTNKDRPLHHLRWLEIVFIFPRLVLQILFQIQFGLSYQCEIYHRHKSNVIKSLHYIFFKKICYHGNHITHSFAPPRSKLIVLLRELVGEIILNSCITCY